MKVQIVEQHNQITIDELVNYKGFIGVTNTGEHRYFWNRFAVCFVDYDGALNQPRESLRKSLIELKCIEEIHIFSTAKELYLWLAEGEE